MLRQQISRMLVQHGLDVTPERFNYTNGSKQGLSLVVHYYVKPELGGVESPTWHGLCFWQHGAKVIGIPTWQGHESRVVGEKPLHLSTKTDFTVGTHNPQELLLPSLIVGGCCNWLNATTVSFSKITPTELNFEPVPAN